MAGINSIGNERELFESTEYDIPKSSELMDSILDSKKMKSSDLKIVGNELREMYAKVKNYKQALKRDLDKIESIGEGNSEFQKRKRIKKSFVNGFVQKAKICGAVNSRGKVCQRIGVCPFHQEGYDAPNEQGKRKRSDFTSMLLIAAASLEKKNVFEDTQKGKDGVEEEK